MKRHELKVKSVYFKAISAGHKTFEIRLNDRDFNLGDVLILREFDDGNYCGRIIKRWVCYITDYEQKKDFIVMGISEIEETLEEGE